MEDEKKLITLEQAKILDKLGCIIRVYKWWVRERKIWKLMDSHYDTRHNYPEYLPACTLDDAASFLRSKGYDIENRVYLVGNSREYRAYIMPPGKTDYIACQPYKDWYDSLSAAISAALFQMEWNQ